MKKIAFLIAVAGLMAGFGAAPAQSTPIVGTGLPGAAGTAETHWTAQVGDNPLPLSGPLLGLTIVNGALDYPGAWVGPAAAEAQWITPYAGGSGNTLAADDPLSHNQEVFYTYALTFDNPNRDINILWSSDNEAEFFFDNLNDIPPETLLSSKDLTGYSTLTSFTILAGAFGTSNTFRVVVRNENAGPPDHDPAIPNPTGLRVDVGPTPVPTPDTLPLFVVGLGLLGWFAYRKKRNAMFEA